jgi:preprotein translocase subunit SecY
MKALRKKLGYSLIAASQIASAIGAPELYLAGVLLIGLIGGSYFIIWLADPESATDFSRV